MPVTSRTAAHHTAESTNPPINVDNLEMQLLGNPDRQKVNYVVLGFREGFHIGFRPHAVKLESAKSNCPSSTEHSVVIDNYLTTGIHAGRVSGPLKTPPFLLYKLVVLALFLRKIELMHSALS